MNSSFFSKQSDSSSEYMDKILKAYGLRSVNIDNTKMVHPDATLAIQTSVDKNAASSSQSSVDDSEKILYDLTERLLTSSIKYQESPNTKYRDTLDILTDKGLLTNHAMDLLKSPSFSFVLYCNEIYYNNHDIYERDLLKILEIIIKTDEDNRLVRDMFNYMKAILRIENNICDKNITIERLLDYYCRINNLESLHIFSIFNKHFGYYNDTPVIYFNQSFQIVSPQAIKEFLKIYQLPHTMTNFNNFLTDLMFKSPKNNNLFKYSSYMDNVLKYYLSGNGRFFSYQYNTNNGTFVLDQSFSFQNAMTLGIPGFWNKRSYVGYIYLLTHGEKKIFDNMSFLFADLLVPKVNHNTLHIILVKEKHEHIIDNLFSCFNELIQFEKTISTFLDHTPGELICNQFRQKRGFLIRSIDKVLTQKQLLQFKTLLNANAIKKKYKIGNKSRRISYFNNLSIIGVATNLSIVDSYSSSFKVNLIDLTHMDNIEPILYIAGLYNWVIAPWTLYGLSNHVETIPAKVNPNEKIFLEDLFLCFFKKYIVIDQKSTSKSKVYLYKEELYSRFCEYYNVMYPHLKLSIKSNTLSKFMRRNYPSISDYRPHKNNTDANLRAYKGITINENLLNEDIKKYYQTSTGLKSKDVSPLLDYIPNDFLELIDQCENLVPDEIKDIIVGKIL